MNAKRQNAGQVLVPNLCHGRVPSVAFLARVGFVGILATGLVDSNTAAAQQPTTGELQQEIQQRDVQIQQLLKRMDALEKEVKGKLAAAHARVQHAEQPASAPPPAAKSQSAQVVPPPSPPPGRTPVQPLISPAPGTSATTTPEEPEDAMIARALENTLVDRGGQLLPPYVFQLVPDFSFGYQSEDQLAFLNNGSIVRQQSHRDLLEWGFGFRIGLPWETQVGFRVPFDLNYGTATFGGTNTFSSNRGGLGDVSLTLQKQVLHEKGWIPDLLVNLNYTAATGSTSLSQRQLSTFPFAVGTGSGFNSLGAGVTALKRQDPLVFLGGLQYTHSFPSTISGVQQTLGDQYFFRVEAILAASPDTSLRVGWLTTFQQKDTVRGFSEPGSGQTISNLEIGVGSVITPKIFLDAALLVGLTHDTPDFTALISLPFRF